MADHAVDQMGTGFRRPLKSDASLEVVLTSADGWTEVLVGRIQVTRHRPDTDAVVRTESASVTHSAGQRLYGKVEGDLMYALDRAGPPSTSCGPTCGPD